MNGLIDNSIQTSEKFLINLLPFNEKKYSLVAMLVLNIYLWMNSLNLNYMSPLEVQSIERKGIFAWVFFI